MIFVVRICGTMARILKFLPFFLFIFDKQIVIHFNMKQFKTDKSLYSNVETIESSSTSQIIKIEYTKEMA